MTKVLNCFYKLYCSNYDGFKKTDSSMLLNIPISGKPFGAMGERESKGGGTDRNVWRGRYGFQNNKYPNIVILH